MNNYTELSLHILTLADGKQFLTWCHEHSKWLHLKLAPNQPATSERWFGGLKSPIISIHPDTGVWAEDNRLGLFSFLKPV